MHCKCIYGVDLVRMCGSSKFYEFELLSMYGELMNCELCRHMPKEKLLTLNRVGKENVFINIQSFSDVFIY